MRLIDLVVASTMDQTAQLRCFEFEELKEESVYAKTIYQPQSIDKHQPTTKRDYVIRELIDTESNYVVMLHAMFHKFRTPMAALLSPDDLCAIFPFIEELSKIHEHFLDRLRDAISSRPTVKLSEVLLEVRAPLLVYGKYCLHLNNACAVLDEVLKNKDVYQLVHRCQQEYNDNHLCDILRVPMQRVQKYHLLVDKLVAETLPTHDDFHGLKLAKEAMVEVGDYADAMMSDSIHLDIIHKVSERILNLNLPGGNDLKQYGRLLHDGELSLKAHDDNKERNRYAFIFVKLLILVKKTGGSQFLYRDSLNLADYRVEPYTTLERKSTFRCQIWLVHKCKSASFTLYMRSQAERKLWSSILQEVVDILDPFGHRSTDHKFVLTNFNEEPVVCLHCSKYLKGLIHQGYLCVVCHRVAHRGCTSSMDHCARPVIHNTLVVHAPTSVSDLELSKFNWFVGSMDRETASMRLKSRKVGTYLVRTRPNTNETTDTIYVLSLKTNQQVIKHMIIYQKREVHGTSVFKLSDRRLFNSIVELVSFYEMHNVGENFAGIINQLLEWPCRELVASALYNFSPTEQHHLPFRQGSLVCIIGKEADSNGWWRGKTMRRVGFFPKEYVREHAQSSGKHFLDSNQF